MLRAKRERKPQGFFKKDLDPDHNQMPRVITVEKNATSPIP